MKIYLLFLFSFLFISLQAQTADDMALIPYDSIPDYPESYNACTVTARMIDGLGFRFYWASKGLTESDLAYRPSEEGRSVEETLYHIYGLSEVVHNAVHKKVNVRPLPKNEMTFEEMRTASLRFLKAASDKLKTSDPADMESMEVVFQRGERKSEFPFWNNLNGPLADAIWHVGQIVVLRRSNGNPIPSRVNVFMGKGPK